MTRIRTFFRSDRRLHALLACAALLPASVFAASGALPLRELTAGMHRIHAEIADTDASRTRGLMRRESLAPNHGMLFIFQDSDTRCFWMRNTPLPLTIAFLDDAGRVVNLADMAPHTETPHCSAEPVRYALEMEQGWFSQRGIQAGARLQGLPEAGR
ncbi:exported protein [plant metagenome]|uniref:Exported protein n=1 Tax=plant metagenome TaxID=1297885 RepID=A0A484TPM4_9ZZZZ